MFLGLAKGLKVVVLPSELKKNMTQAQDQPLGIALGKPLAGSKYKLETLLKKLSDFKGQKICEFVHHLQELNKNTQDESLEFAAASSSPSKPASKAECDQLSAAQQPAAAPSHQAAEEVPMSRVSQDERDLPKVPCASQASSCNDLDVEKALPISTQTIRENKGMKRPAGVTRPA